MGNRNQRPLTLPPVAINRPVIGPAGRPPGFLPGGPGPMPILMQQSQLFIQPQPIIYHQPIIPMPVPQAPCLPACLPPPPPPPQPACLPPPQQQFAFPPALPGPAPCGPPAIAFGGGFGHFGRPQGPIGF